MTSPLRGVRLVALDLDGTLLPSSKVLTERAIRVAADLRDAGIALTLATGKGWNHTRRYAEELGIDVPVVALEGAYVARVGGAPALASRTLPKHTVTAVLGAVAGVDVGWFYCHDRGRTRAHRRLERWLPQLSIWDPFVDFTDDEPHAPGDAPHDAFVLHLVGPPAEVAAAKTRVGALGLDDVELFHQEFWHGHEQLHVRPRGTDKEHGVRRVMQDLGVTEDELLAAGDWWNDLGMLGLARVAVAPANAIESVRGAADHVLPATCDDDAVAVFLEDALRTL